MKIEVVDVSLVSTWAWDIPRERNVKDSKMRSNSMAQNDEECEDQDIDNIDNTDTDTDEEDDVCGICRNRYDGTCPSCEYPGNGCPIVLGLCNHNFHVHCIKQWLSTETSKGLCPLCRQGFQLRPQVTINKPHYEDLRQLLMSARQHNIPMGGPDVDQEMMDEGFIR